MNYRNTDEDCPGCGSTAAERKAAGHTYSGLSVCPHCESEKCAMCDMGDDVECGSCDLGESTDDATKEQP